jgi:hypothetical protein
VFRLIGVYVHTSRYELHVKQSGIVISTNENKFTDMKHVM